ncbi:MAG: citrate synthase, partial [Actinomycetia bacterium]|nr:citrate synthase [Actinomycetes bacterium]
MQQNYLAYKLADTIKQTAKIPPELFARYGVKRGLRNDDGSGVLVGLTRIGNVVGYDRDDSGALVPVPGRLFYRGYDVEDIVAGVLADDRRGFEEVAYLLLSGSLPDAEELASFRALLIENMPLPHDAVMSILALRGSNVMNILARSVLELYTHDPDPEGLSREHSMEQSIALIAQFPVIIAYAYNVLRHHTQGLPLHVRLPKPELSLAENFLYMLRKDFTPLDARVLDLILILQAEHGGGNNSAFTVRVVSSSMTDIYSAVAAGIGSLKGPLHGGANAKVADQFAHLKAAISDWKDTSEIRTYLERMLNRQAYDGTGLIYGIGHAVYTVSDPRVEPLREQARMLAEEKGRSREFEFLDLVGQQAVEVVSRVKMGGGPVTLNVDFFSGFLYELIGIPPELYTPLFAMSRIVGWVAHRNEEVNFSGRRIIRPAYRCV